jgi:hypothetical protein
LRHLDIKSNTVDSVLHFFDGGHTIGVPAVVSKNLKKRHRHYAENNTGNAQDNYQLNQCEASLVLIYLP